MVKTDAAPPNKAAVGAFLQVWACSASFSPLAGRGGRGRWSCAVEATQAWADDVVLPSLAGRGGEERGWRGSCCSASAWKQVAGVLACWRRPPFLLPLDGRGGEGSWSLVGLRDAVPRRRQVSSKLKLRQIPSVGVERRRYPWPKGPLRTSRALAPRIVFLQAVMPSWRPSDLDMATHPAVGPSGVVPGAGASGHGSRSCVGCGGEEGPDCFSFSLFGVLLVICEGLLFVRVLFINLPTE